MLTSTQDGEGESETHSFYEVNLRPLTPKFSAISQYLVEIMESRQRQQFREKVLCIVILAVIMRDGDDSESSEVDEAKITRATDEKARVSETSEEDPREDSGSDE